MKKIAVHVEENFTPLSCQKEEAGLWLVTTAHAFNGFVKQSLHLHLSWKQVESLRDVLDSCLNSRPSADNGFTLTLYTQDE